jgi:YesN/AraC family two-component response regulator
VNKLRFSKILIVDDSQAFRIKTKMILTDAQIGMRYYEAKDGKEAISQYIAHKPHLTIMDINMPTVDGIKATQAILKYDPNAVIIIISTMDNKDTIDAVIKNGGAKDYLIKPCDSSAIIMAASKQLVKSRLHKRKT